MIMYKAFYSLAGEPFTKEIKTKDMFASSAHLELLARLEYLKDKRGIGLVVGEAGCGKTSGIRAFANGLNPALFKVVYFALSTVTVSDFYRGIAYSLDLEPRTRKVDLFKQLQDSIMELYRDKRILPVIILDEMHLASTQFLCDLHLLFNFAMDSQNPFVLILCGLPHLASRLAINHHQVLQQRVIMRFKMTPLSKEEIGLYLTHQLKLAGANHPIFSPAAIEAISTVSRGYPRLINSLGNGSMIYGFQNNLNLLDEEAIRQAAMNIGI
jgi:type II secretory pathway predicted ATPase ExeA